jgi:hypothetical protein
MRYAISLLYYTTIIKSWSHRACSTIFDAKAEQLRKSRAQPARTKTSNVVMGSGSACSYHGALVTVSLELEHGSETLESKG